MTTTEPRRSVLRRRTDGSVTILPPEPEFDPEDIDLIMDQEAANDRLLCRNEMPEPLEDLAVQRLRRPDRTAANEVPLDPHDLYPLDAPGMPVPGPDLTGLAQVLGSDAEIQGKGKNQELVGADKIMEDLIKDILYSRGACHIPMTIKGTQQTRLAVVTGHVWGEEDPSGPQQADVMVIGKCLGEDEKITARQAAGPSGILLRETCEKLGIPCHSWYMTSLLKTEHPEAASGGSTIRAARVKEWLPVLHQELRLVRPKYILCLGTDALKALLGAGNTLKKLDGRVVEYQFPVSREAGPEGQVINHQSLLMAVTNPAAVLHNPDQQGAFEHGMSRFGTLVSGNRPDRKEEDLDHREIDTLEGLKALHQEIEENCEDNLIAIDAEWHGEHPNDAASYIRMIQISWAHKKAVAIHLTHPGGAWRFDAPRPVLASWVKKICSKRRIAGHFLNADLEWLVHLGIDIRKWFAVPDTWQKTMKRALRTDKHARGGFDTGLALHAIAETDDFALTSVALRFTAAPRYDVELIKWKHDYCRDHDIKQQDLDGFGECPDEVLTPYGIYDACVTRRIAVKLQQLLTRDRFGNNCWEAFWMTMRASPAALEISMTGLMIDRKRMDSLTDTYMAARVRLEKTIRDWARWPDFNLNSALQVREFLFGERLNGKERTAEGVIVRLRPKKGVERVRTVDGKKEKYIPEVSARSLLLTPIISTDKRPMQWDEVIQKRLEDRKTPSTNKTALAILAQEAQKVIRPDPATGRNKTYDMSKQVTWIRDYRFISQVLRQTLRVPALDDETDDFARDDNGDYEYSKGLPHSICDDGRVRTHIYMTKETGRWSSARPPMQNITKRREKDYKRILGDAYTRPIRSIIQAPKGCVLIEADYTGAELFGMAVMSGDTTMIAHAQRNILPEDDPEYYDIHSNTAVLAFNLDCEPTKAGLLAIDKSALRIAAKNVIFGVAYGRGAKAIALQCKEEGNPIAVYQAQKIIDTIFALYPELKGFFDSCQARATDPRWLCGCFGRFRRFQVARDRKAEGDAQRQAQNFPIQGMIADVVTRACDHLYHYREEHDVEYRIALQIHDAVLLQVPYEHVPRVMDEVLPECMVNRVPIYPSHLDGTWAGTGPYHLGIDQDPFVWWGEDMSPADCLSRGIDPKYAKWVHHGEYYTHPHKVNRQNEQLAWVGDASGGKFHEMHELAS